MKACDPDIILLTETHYVDIQVHPFPLLNSCYPHFICNSYSSSSGGVAILSKYPIKLLQSHKSGNMIHAAIKEIPFLLIYAHYRNDKGIVEKNNMNKYYARKLAKRVDKVPESLIFGDLNTNFITPTPFNTLLLDKFYSPHTSPDTAPPTWFPRGKGVPKPLDWALIPPSLGLLDFKVIPQQQINPVSDHAAIFFKLNASNLPNTRQYISASLYEDLNVQNSLRAAGERIASEDSENKVAKYLAFARTYLLSLTTNIAKINSITIETAKGLSWIDKTTSSSIKAIIKDRIRAIHSRYVHFSARARNRASSHMSSLQRPFNSNTKISNYDAHFEYWSNLYSDKADPVVSQVAMEHIFSFTHNFLTRLTLSQQNSLNADIKLDEVKEIINKAPKRSTPGHDLLSYEVFIYMPDSLTPHLTDLFNSWYSSPSTLPHQLSHAVITLLD